MLNVLKARHVCLAFFIVDIGLGIKMKNKGKVTYTFKLFIFG